MSRAKTQFELDIAEKVRELGYKEALRRVTDTLFDEDDRTFVGEDGVRYSCDRTDCYCDDLKPGENCRNWKSIEQRTAEVTADGDKVAKVSIDSVPRRPEATPVVKIRPESTEPCPVDTGYSAECLECGRFSECRFSGAAQRRSEATPEVGGTEHVAFWEAIHDYVHACGGETESVSGAKMIAVVAVEKAAARWSYPAYGQRRSEAQPHANIGAGGGDEDEPGCTCESPTLGVVRCLNCYLRVRTLDRQPAICDACGEDFDVETKASTENAQCHRTLGCARERDHGGACDPRRAAASRGEP